jgi:hypothetical protein
MKEQEAKTKTEAMVREMLDREAIRDVINRFAIGADQGDWDKVASCFTPDAYFDSGPIFQGKIKEAIPIFHESLARFESTMHLTGTQVIELGGDKANVETYSIDYHRLNVEGKQKDIIVGIRFLDNLVRQDEKWLIQRRVAKFVWQREDAVVLPTGI